MLVKAIGRYYGRDLRLRREGEIFELADEKYFSARWLEKVEEEAPQGKPVIDHRRKPLAPSKQVSPKGASPSVPTGDQEVI